MEQPNTSTYLTVLALLAFVVLLGVFFFMLETSSEIEPEASTRAEEPMESSSAPDLDVEEVSGEEGVPPDTPDLETVDIEATMSI